jgi:hypothetical protein
VLSTCSSLITIVDDGWSQVVQFSHFSVKEYLTSDRLANAGRGVSCYHILAESAHTILAQACLGVLLRLDDHVDKENAGDIRLANYAAEHWVDHAWFKDVSSRVQDAVEVFLDADKPHHAACLRLHRIDDGVIGFHSRTLAYLLELPFTMPPCMDSMTLQSTSQSNIRSM